MPDPTKLFYVESGASKWATGAILQQRDNNENLKPCSYISHTSQQQKETMTYTTENF